MICIKQVERKTIEPLAGSAGNQYVLRADEKTGTVHVAYFDDDESVIGCLSMSVTAKACFDAIPQYKIDGIAVAKNKQNQGVGFALVKMAEFIALNNQVGCVWLDNGNSAADYFKNKDTFRWRMTKKFSLNIPRIIVALHAPIVLRIRFAAISTFDLIAEVEVFRVKSPVVHKFTWRNAETVGK